MRPSLSIVMTVYNVARFLQQAIESILNQSFNDFSFVIVDDGSTDNSRNIILSYSDDRIRFFPHAHVGRAGALNIAMRKVETKYVGFMDADDVSMKHRLETQINFLRENNEVGVLSNAYEIINDRGKVLRTVRLPLYHNEIEQAMTKHCSCCFPSSIMRTEAIHTVGGFNENLVSAEDFDLFLRLLPVTTFRNISSILFQYRKSPPSISVKEKLSMRRNTHTLSHNYLLARLSSEKDNSMVAGMCFRLGVNEYYHGSMRSAREYFFKSLRYGYNKKAVGRYLLPTMLGDTIFRVFRYFRNREYFLV